MTDNQQACCTLRTDGPENEILAEVVVKQSGAVQVSAQSFPRHFMVVTESIYPLCGDAVQTEILCHTDWDTSKEARIRPDTYTQRAVFETYSVGGDSAGDDQC